MASVPRNKLAEVAGLPQTSNENALSRVATLRSRTPTFRENIASFFRGGEKIGGVGLNRLVQGLTGVNSLTGEQSFGLIDLTPFGISMAAEESADEFSRGNNLTAIATGLGALPLPAAALTKRVSKSLPLDEASRMARAEQQGFSDQTFFRGEATGRFREEFPGGAFFSRDENIARGFAQRGGADNPDQFKLNIQNAFSDAEPVTAKTFSNLVQSAKKVDPSFADNMADLVAEGQNADWMLEFAKRNPDVVVSENGTLIRAFIEKSRAPEAIFLGAGFDALDVGQDVRKLSGDGIRRKEAAFDPDKTASRNVFHAAPLAVVPLAAGAFSTEQQR